MTPYTAISIGFDFASRWLCHSWVVVQGETIISIWPLDIASVAKNKENSGHNYYIEWLMTTQQQAQADLVFIFGP